MSARTRTSIAVWTTSLPYQAEGWRFDHGCWRKYPILNLTFDRIPQ